MIKNMLSKKGGMALSQIIILVVGIFATMYIIGSGIGVVGATGIGNLKPGDTFSYNGITFTIQDSNYITGSNGYDYRFNSSHCTASSMCNWYWDWDKDGAFTGVETNKANGGINICMDIGFRNAMVAPEKEEGDDTSDEDGTGEGVLLELLLQTIGRNSVLASAITQVRQWLNSSGLSQIPTLPEGGGDTTLMRSNFQIAFKIVEKFAVHAGIAVGFYYLGSALASLNTNILNTEEYANAVALASALGYGVGATLTEIIIATGAGESFWVALGTSAALGPAILIGAGLAIVAGGLTALLYPTSTQEIVMFNCYTWTPETGGTNCDQCGSDGLPCSKYECLTLGQECSFENEGTEDEICVKIDSGISPPYIEAWNEALPSDKYNYAPLETTLGDTGVKIQYSDSTDGCVPYWTPISFGVELDEAATCKYNLERVDSYEDMQSYFSNRLILYNHSLSTTFASIEALEASDITLDNSGEWNVYVRCEDTGGNSNVANFVFQFCVSDEPDTTPPEIKYFSPFDGMPVSQGQSAVDMIAYINEPVEGCRWDYSDTPYESMTHEMICPEGVRERNAFMLYECTGTVDGLTDSTENTYYFRCNDTAGNVMTNSEDYTLIGTRNLVIDSVNPEGIISGASNTIKVTLEAETSAGYDEGAAVCYYSEGCYLEGGSDASWVQFAYETGTESYSQHQHSQVLWLGGGNYDCSIKCSDLGGNLDIATTSYTVESDLTAPTVVRAYYDGGSLVLITSEPAQCVYGTSTCNYLFDDGIRMSSSNDITHSTAWETTDTLYVKCQDEQGVQPPSGSCSIILRPFEFF